MGQGHTTHIKKDNLPPSMCVVREKFNLTCNDRVHNNAMLEWAGIPNIFTLFRMVSEMTGTCSSFV